MSLRTLGTSFAATFGLSWGIVALLILFPDQKIVRMPVAPRRHLW
jgi:hypothetical protein